MEPKDLVEVAKVAGPVAALYSPLVQKLLGPTADYLGNVIKSFTQKGAENVAAVMKYGIKRVGGRINQDESVPAKVLKGFLLEAPFCEDQLAAEYLGGVLASSRSGVDRDDRGAALISLIGRLSAYEIRSHYVFYTVIKRLHDGSGLVVGNADDRDRAEVFIPWDGYWEAMEFQVGEDGPAILNHTMFGLAREDLIDTPDFWFGDRESLLPIFPGATGSGIIVRPSNLGALLYMWGHGRFDLRMESFLDDSVSFESETCVLFPSGSLARSKAT